MRVKDLRSAVADLCTHDVTRAPAPKNETTNDEPFEGIWFQYAVLKKYGHIRVLYHYSTCTEQTHLHCFFFRILPSKSSALFEREGFTNEFVLDLHCTVYSIHIRTRVLKCAWSSEWAFGSLSAPASCVRLGRVEQVDATLVRHRQHLLRHLHIKCTQLAMNSKLRY